MIFNPIVARNVSIFIVMLLRGHVESTYNNKVEPFLIAVYLNVQK